MTASRYRYYPADKAVPFGAEAIAAATQYPGVRAMRDGSIEAPLNAAFLVERWLQHLGVSYKPWTPKEKPIKRWSTIAELVQHAGLRSHDPKTGLPIEDFCMPYQKREPLAHADNEGSLFQWPAGSGKTCGSIIYALLYDGPIAVVTGAKGRPQWRDAIRRFTTHEPVILAGTGHIGEVELPVYERAVPKGEKAGKAFPAELRASFKTMVVHCSCAAKHRHMLFTRGSRKLFVRVWLPPGHHDLSFTAGNMTTMAQPFDIDEPEIPKDARFIVCGWETLPYHVDKIVAAKPVTAIFDELHRSKSHRRVEMVELTDEQRASEPKAKQLEDGRWVKYVDLENIVSATKKLAYKAQRRCGLTATPVKDRVRDLWAQLDCLVPYGFGSYWSRNGSIGFASRYCAAAKNVWGGMDDRGASNLDELTARVSYHLSYVSMAEANANLPDKRRELIRLSPDAQQREDEGFADELMRAARARASVHSIANIRLAAACSRKRKALIEQVVEETNGGAKVVIFTARHHDVDALKGALKGKLAKTVRLFATDGRNTSEKRDDLRKEYMQLASHALFISTYQAMGEQNDLNETDIAHVALLPYTWAEVLQLEGRFLRRDSTRKVLVNYWVAEGTADERVASILLEKLPAVERMGTEGIQGMRQAFTGNEEELLAALASDILSGGAAKIEGVADGD